MLAPVISSLDEIYCILFQKLAVAAERTYDIDPETIFKHELTTIPKALAETPELLHEAQKSTVADTHEQKIVLLGVAKRGSYPAYSMKFRIFLVFFSFYLIKSENGFR